MPSPGHTVAAVDETPRSPGRRFVVATISILVWAYIALSCIPMFFVAFAVYLLTRPFDPKGRVLHLFSCAWAQIYVLFNPMWTQHIEGRSNLPWNGKAVLVANHQSLTDILVLFGLFRPFKWVSKASIFKVPFMGWNMRLNGYVPLVRGERSSVQVMMQRCLDWLARDVPILMFPEGTRSKDGDVRRFKDGAFQLAIESGAPVIPIVIEGTADTLPKHGFIMDDPGRAYVRILEPIDPAPFGDDYQALRDHVRTRIVVELEKIRQNAK